MTHITHAFGGFSVNDLEAAKKFYTDILGVEVKEEPGMGLNLVLPGGGNFFIYPSKEHAPAGYTALNFVVENIETAVDELVGKGVVIERYEGFHQDEKGIMRGIAAKMGPDIAWFKDPAGNTLSVIQEK